MTNLRLPPRYRVRCHAQRAAAAPWPRPRRHAGHCGPTRTALQPPSLFNRSACTLPTATPPGPAHVAVGCKILLQHQQRAACPCAPALHTHPLCMLPRTISRHFQHGALAPLSRGCNTNAAPPPASPLPSAAHEGCAAQHRRAGGQGDDGFISENKRNVKKKRVRRRGDIQRDCEARDAS